MTDREGRDLARNEKRNTPSPRKKTQNKFAQDEDKENEDKGRSKKSLFPQNDSPQKNTDEVRVNSEFSHPVYKEISLNINSLI